MILFLVLGFCIKICSVFNSQGSEKLFQLVSDGSQSSNTYSGKKETEHEDSENESLGSDEPHWVSIHILL